MDQTTPEFFGSIPSSEVADALGIETALIDQTDLPVEKISTGLADIIVPVPKGVLDRLTPNMDKVAVVSKRYNAIGFHVFELNNEENTATASCRNFAPAFGIDEECATGSASGALACYLWRFIPEIGNQFTFEQGRAMGETSAIFVNLESDGKAIQSVKVGGVAKIIDSASYIN